MESLVSIFLARIILRFIGKYCRYIFYIIIGRPKSLYSLTNESSKNKSFGDALTQDFINAVIGLIVFCFVSIFIAWLVWG
jgi:TRAP-type mannitol/chloroaromatic compound transport system permease large subunit